jgi:two-component system, NtrC family, sensor histidine kinase PilS
MRPVTTPGEALVVPPLAAPPHDEILFSQLQWSMLTRLLAVTGLFGVVLFLRFHGEGPVELLAALYPVFIALYALSALYALVVKRMPNLVFFTYLQFAVDAACISLVLVFTGGAESMFTWLFVFNVLGAGYLLQLRGGLTVATLDTVAYLICLVLTWTGVVPTWSPDGTLGEPLTEYPEESLRQYSTVAFHVVSFYLLAFLSGSLSGKHVETGRVLAETASSLHRLQNMHGRIVQNLDAGLLTIDREGRITSFNRAAEQITRYLASEVLGRRVGGVLKGIDRLLEATAESGSSTRPGPSFERWMTRKDRKRVYLRVGASVMRDADGRVDGQILVFEDRTRMLLMEEQLEREERLAAVGRLSAAIAHEIRNPLASITGSAQVLRSELDLATEDDELLGLIEREADRLGHLVTDFLQLTRGDKPSLASGSVGVLIKETVALVRTKGVGEGITISSTVGYDPVVRIDGARIRQVLWNLVNNACQVMSGGGRLRIWTERVTADDLGAEPTEESFVGSWNRAGDGSPRIEESGVSLLPGEGALRVVVEDTGPGIPDEELGRIFDPFFTTRAGGTGLGLAIVARIVQAHGGVVTVHSQLGEGTRFAIWLPLDDEVTDQGGAEDSQREIALPVEVEIDVITDKYRAPDPDAESR